MRGLWPSPPFVKNDRWAALRGEQSSRAVSRPMPSVAPVTRSGYAVHMSYSLELVRFPAGWLPSLRHDRAAAEHLALRRGEGVVRLDLGRREDELYALLRPAAPRQMIQVTRPDDLLAYALIGHDWLLERMPPIDTGYGTPHLVAAEQVLQIAALLAPLDAATLQARTRHQDPALAAHLVEQALALRTFYLDAAAAAEAIVITPS